MSNIPYIPFTISVILSYRYVELVVSRCRSVYNNNKKVNKIHTRIESWLCLSFLFSFVSFISLLIGQTVFDEDNRIDLIGIIADVSDVSLIIAFLAHIEYILSIYQQQILPTFPYYQFIKRLQQCFISVIILNILVFLLLFALDLPEWVAEVAESLGLYILFVIACYILYVNETIVYPFEQPGEVVDGWNVFKSILKSKWFTVLCLIFFGFHEAILAPIIEQWPIEGELAQLILMRFSGIVFVLMMEKNLS